MTEFDEAKIPELPADSSSNIQGKNYTQTCFKIDLFYMNTLLQTEQYDVTFEKCFVPTFKATRNSAGNFLQMTFKNCLQITKKKKKLCH